MEDRMYLLTIRLDGIQPEIWRCFVVPGDITLDRLHDVIEHSPRQAAGSVHRKDKEPIFSSLANPAARSGECARCNGSNCDGLT
jgi:hypothetical protein